MFKEKKWSNRIQLILLFVIFSAPLVGAYIYKAYITSGDRVYNTVNKGEFYSRPLDLADISFTISDKEGKLEEKTFNNFDSRWYLLVIADQQCNAVCEANLEKISYVKVVHARYAGRIVSTLVHNGLSVERSKELRDKFGLSVIEAKEREKFQEWLEPFYKGRSQNEFDADRIYMVDPLKKLMMSYPVDVLPLDIYEDMKRLLKTSRVG